MMIVFAAVFVLAAVPGSSAGGHKQGFLAFEPRKSVIDPSFKERRLWDEFQESEKKLDRSGDILKVPPGGPPPPSHIMPVDYTVEILIGPSPCEKKIQQCLKETKLCKRMLEDLRLKIAVSVSRMQDMANINPLLNTLQIRSDAQSKVPLVEFEKISRNSKIRVPPQPPLWARINPTMKPVDSVGKVDWEALAGLNKAKEKMKRVEQKIDRRSPQRYLHQEYRSPDGIPLSRIPDGMEQQLGSLQKNAPDVAQGIAQHIVEVLPKRVVQAAANQLNQKCNGMQTLMLDDCLSFAQACKDDLAEKKHRFRALGQTIHDHEEERQKY